MEMFHGHGKTVDEWVRITGVSRSQANVDFRSGLLVQKSDGVIDIEATLRALRLAKKALSAAELDEKEIDLELKRAKLQLARAQLAECVQDIQDDALTTTHTAIAAALAEFVAEHQGDALQPVAESFAAIVQKALARAEAA